MALDTGKDTRRPHSHDIESREPRNGLHGRETFGRDVTGREAIGRDTIGRASGGTSSYFEDTRRGERTFRTGHYDRNDEREAFSSSRRTAPGGFHHGASFDDTSVVQINGAGESQSNNEFERRRRQNKKKAFRTRVIAMIVVEALTLLLIISGGMVYRYMQMTQNVDFDISKVKNTNIDVSAQQKMKGYWTVAVFGVDSRDGNLGKGANADVQIIANVNMETGDVKLVSVYRDTYLNLKNGSRYAKSNEAYASGGPEQAVAMLNRNLDLDIQNYATFNWKAVADTVEMLGGTDIDISDKEFYYMNAYIHETCVKSGIDSKNPAAHYIKSAGPQHLDGVQTVAYARLRYMDNDFERTKRQREVIAQCLQKAKQCDLSTLTAIIDKVLPQVAFNIDTADIIQLAKGISRYNITGSEGFPKNLTTRMMGKKGDCVIPKTLKSNVVELHQFLFNDMDYVPSSAVESYSAKIMDDYAQAGIAKSEAETKPEKESEKSTAEYEEVTETDKNGKTITVKKKKTTQETDEDGYLIKGTDEDGNNIYVRDADGNKVKASSKNTKEAKEAEVLETDADGNPIDSKKKKTKDNEDGEDADASDPEAEEHDGRVVSPFERETDASGNYVEDTTTSGRKSTKETSRDTKETTHNSPSNSSNNSDDELIAEGPGTESEEFTPGGPFGGPQ